MVGDGSSIDQGMLDGCFPNVEARSEDEVDSAANLNHLKSIPGRIPRLTSVLRRPAVEERGDG